MVENMNEIIFPTAGQAAAALESTRVAQRSAIEAVYRSPWWFFAGLGVTVIVFNFLMQSSDWIYEQFGRVVEISIMIVGIAFFGAVLGLLVGLLRRVQRAEISRTGPGTTIVMLVAFGIAAALLVVGYLVFDKVEVGVYMIGVGIAVFGMPLQAFFRKKALDNLDRDNKKE